LFHCDFSMMKKSKKANVSKQYRKRREKEKSSRRMS